MALDQELGLQMLDFANKMDEDALLAELGQRVETLKKEPATKSQLSTLSAVMPLAPQPTAGPWLDAVVNMGKTFLSRFNRDLYRLMCDKSDPDNKEIRDAFATGEVAASTYVAGLLVSTFAWLPAIVAIVGGLIIRRFIKSAANETYDQICTTWGKELGIVK